MSDREFRDAAISGMGFRPTKRGADRRVTDVTLSESTATDFEIGLSPQPHVLLDHYLGAL